MRSDRNVSISSRSYGRGPRAPAIHRRTTACGVAVLPAAPLYVRGDPGRLRQVVSNLVENAAKYTQPGGRITVTLEPRGDEAVLAVSDNGIGIAAKPRTDFRAVHAITSTADQSLQWIRNRTQRRAPNRGIAWWSGEGDQRGCRRGKRVRGLAAGVGAQTHGTTEGPRT